MAKAPKKKGRKSAEDARAFTPESGGSNPSGPTTQPPLAPHDAPIDAQQALSLERAGIAIVAEGMQRRQIGTIRAGASALSALGRVGARTRRAADAPARQARQAEFVAALGRGDFEAATAVLARAEPQESLYLLRLAEQMAGMKAALPVSAGARAGPLVIVLTDDAAPVQPALEEKP